MDGRLQRQYTWELLVCIVFVKKYRIMSPAELWQIKNPLCRYKQGHKGLELLRQHEEPEETCNHKTVVSKRRPLDLVQDLQERQHRDQRNDQRCDKASREQDQIVHRQVV